jgi:type I restriction enzyme R subunit
MNDANFTENSYEQAIIALFEQMGYRYECGYDVERDPRNPLHEEVLGASLRSINPELTAHGIDEMMKALKEIEGTDLVAQNETFTDYLQNGIPVEDKVGGDYRTVNARLIDYDRPEANDFRIVNQWTVEEFATKRCDLVVMLNGLPLVVMELKSPSNEGVGEDDAYNQIKAYQKQIPCLFVYNAFNVISDMLTTRVGTLTAKQERYMEWKTVDGEYESTAVADYATFFRGIFQKGRLLDLIHNFLCFDKADGKAWKILGAYHQYFAVNKALSRTRDAVRGNGKIGVFWHTQGSGKSFSMLFFTHLVIKHFAESTILVVTDRKDLDQQLYGQFGRCKEFLRTEPVNATSRSELIELLKNRQSGGIIFTTIQKFEEGDEPLSTRKNIIVMTDEAHRSQYGDEHWDTKAETMKKGQALKMREALPNASFIGFTGTPISNRDKDTTEVFGDYIDIYDMTQAVAEAPHAPCTMRAA